MAPEPALVFSRRRVLSNSCSEFVENRAGQAIVSSVLDVSVDTETEEIASPEFVRGIDAFVPHGQAPSEEEIYKPSKEKVEEFQGLLKQFTEMLRSRNYFKDIGIKIRNPEDFDIEYILSIAKVIMDKKGASENSRTCMGFIRKCCKSTSKHADTIRLFINLAPGDIYGSLISGGFTMILAAVEDHQRLRDEIQAALASIPKKLKEIRTLSEVHQSLDLHQCANGVFISIFAVLSRIIDRVSMSLTERFTSKFKGRGSDVKEALEAFENSIGEFQRLAEICSQQKLGRIEENTKASKVVLDAIKQAVDGAGTNLQDMKKIQESTKDAVKDAVKELPEVFLKQLEATCYNLIYQFHAGSPSFNAVDGTVNRGYAMYLLGSQGKEIDAPRSGSVVFSLDKHKELVEAWFDNLDDFDPASDEHVAKCLQNAENLKPEDKDKVQYIMHSDEFRSWLGQSQSCLVEVRAETAPQDLVNFMSLTSAMLTTTLGTATDFAVLSFFCGLRTNKSRDEDESGVMAILNSFNGQLLQFILEKRQTVDLSLLEDKKRCQKSTQKTKHGFSLFKELLSLLPDGDMVFIFLDSISRISGDKKKGDELVEKIVDIMEEMEIVIKILVTDCLPNSQIKRLAHGSLYVADDVDGWRNGINTKSLTTSVVEIHEIHQVRQQRAGSSEEEEDSESTSDEDDW